MSKEQDAEIETIRGRDFKLNLSAADVVRLFEKAGSVGLTPSELLENFIGDLVYGTYTNGSDERMYANAWFDRCGFSMGFGELSFLQWLILSSDVDGIVDDWNTLKDYKELDENELDEDDIVYMNDVESDLNMLFKDYLKDYLSHSNAVKDTTLEEEMPKVIEYYNEKRSACADCNVADSGRENGPDDEDECEC